VLRAVICGRVGRSTLLRTVNLTAKEASIVDLTLFSMATSASIDALMRVFAADMGTRVREMRYGRPFVIGEQALRPNAYSLDRMRRRVLAGLTSEETTEFELLDAQLPFDGKPVWPSQEWSLSPKEQRWLELFQKMEHARAKSAS
jgi:hypothetical protein